MKGRWNEDAIMEISLFITLVIMTLKDVDCLKNVVLTLEPAVVEKSHSCIVRCTYDLEDVPLYVVKWYRGSKEFYRFTPDDNPSTKILKIPEINVDEEKSNSTQVVLRNVDFNLSGNFTCEVTTDNGFSTAHDIKVLQVVQLRQYPPAIQANTEPLNYGDTLTANCMSTSSKPPPTLKLLLNNKIIGRTNPVTNVLHELAGSDLSVELELNEEHFVSDQMVLRCEAQIGDVYRNYTEVKLNTAHRGPVFQRVSAYNLGTSNIEASKTFFVLLIIFSCLTLVVE